MRERLSRAGATRRGGQGGRTQGIDLASYILSKRINERVHVAVKAGFHDVAQELVEAGARALHVAKASPLPGLASTRTLSGALPLGAQPPQRVQRGVQSWAISGHLGPSRL